MRQPAADSLKHLKEGKNFDLCCLMYRSGSILMVQAYILPQSAPHCRIMTTATEQTGTQVTCFFPPSKSLFNCQDHLCKKQWYDRPSKTSFLLHRDKFVFKVFMGPKFWTALSAQTWYVYIHFLKKIPDGKEAWGDRGLIWKGLKDDKTSYKMLLTLTYPKKRDK